MKALPIVESPLGSDVFEEAANLYRLARRTGLTIRSSVDCLIGACAIRHDLELMHRDRDFNVLAAISPCAFARFESRALPRSAEQGRAAAARHAQKSQFQPLVNDDPRPGRFIPVPSSSFESLKQVQSFWVAANEPPPRALVIYGGAEDQSRTDGRIVSWRHLHQALGQL